MVDDFPTDRQLSDIHFAAVACDLAKTVFDFQHALGLHDRPWNDLTPTERARRIDHAAAILRFTPIAKEGSHDHRDD